MKFNDVKTIAVIGAGDVGHGIALGLALAGYQVHLDSTTEANLQKRVGSTRSDLLVQEKVDKDELGAKSGRGFLDRTPDSAEATRRKMANAFIEIKKRSQDGN